ncbi:MAG: hypothetical protein IT433_04855 [Phycisphaerales bacterium]|nr:hypothetical protein [Phycisphaerales bacterium]
MPRARTSRPLVRLLRPTTALALLALAAPSLYAQPAGGPAPAAAALDASSTALPIQRITMYRSGVASFERTGSVTGDANLQFRFSTAQINDILQSMVVLDLSKGKGRIDGISYGSKEPLAKRLASFGVDIADNPAAGELLARLRGTPVRLTLAAGEVTGTVMNVETRPTVFQGSNGTDTAVHNLPWINLLTAEGVRSYNLTECRGFEIRDEALAAELSKALAALAEYRADRTKTVDVSLSGEGSREIVVAYVQESPVWKTSYRLVLPEETKDSPGGSLTLQGWAIVENTTDEDWRDVTLSLVSGRPVSFRMDLYEPLYMDRPLLPVPSEQGAMARLYDGSAGFEIANALKDEAKAVQDSAMLGVPAGAPRPAAPAEAEAGGARGRRMSYKDLDSSTAAAQARAVESGEVFQFEVDHPVTVERQRSAMIPIINTALKGRRVSIYTASEGGQHPMRGLEITNSTGLQLMPGPISVFDDGAYAGDAQVSYVPQGDKRLLAYALDLDVVATSDDRGEEEVRRVRVVQGLLELQVKYRRSVTYAFGNKDASRPRTIITEYPRDTSWELAEGTKPTETTDSVLRFETTAGPGGSATQKIALERTVLQTYQLAEFATDTLMLYAKNGRASDAVVNAFREAQKKKGAILDLQRQIAALERERGEINTDQGRIRQNMGTGTIDRQSDLYTRYVKKLGEQETRLEAIADALVTANTDLNRANADLAAYLAALNVE